MPTNPNMVAIQTVTVGSGGAASIEFTSIPQTYTDLVIKVSARSNLAQSYGDWISVRFNGNSSSTYTTKRLRTNPTSSTVASDGDTNYTQLVQGQAASANATANTFGNTEFYIPNYAGSNQKSVSSDFAPENNGSYTIMGFAAGIWANTSAITQVTLIPQDGTSFAQYSTATLYGVTAFVGETGGKATGGTVTSDANYWYHTFTSSGMFVPSQNVTCDYLVVGGGGGGGGGIGGGGGAGGYRTFTSQSLTSGTNYTVLVGGGGLGWPNGASSNGNGIAGSDSVFNTNSSAGGGYGGGAVGSGGNGGSGGGAGGAALTNGTGNTPSTSPAQGTNGGSGANGAGNRGGGGGGGATNAGANGTSSGGGNGGAGTASSISGTSITYAGGGGGGCDPSGTIGTGGSGGGGNGANTSLAAGAAGTSNRGSGGGGGGPSGNGGNGGSGIVIVRYAK